MPGRILSKNIEKIFSVTYRPNTEPNDPSQPCCCLRAEPFYLVCCLSAGLFYLVFNFDEPLDYDVLKHSLECAHTLVMV